MPENSTPGPVSDGVTITFSRQQAYEGSTTFGVHIAISLGGHTVSVFLTLLPNAVMPIELDSTQKLILLVREDELLVDSSQVARDVPITVEERIAPP